MKVALISPFSMSGGGSTRLRDLVKHTDTEWVLILPEIDKYGGSPSDPHLFHPIGKKSYLKIVSWMIKCFWYLVKFRPDVVHALKPHPFTIRPALLYKILFRKRIIFDCDEWDSYTLKDNNTAYWQILVSDIMSWFGIRFFDAILYANHLVLKEKIPEKFHSKCYYVPNGVDVDEFTPRDKDHDGFNVFFVGMLQKYKHIEPIVSAIELVKSEVPDVKCNIVGGGVGLEILKEKVKEKGISNNFIFHGLKPHKEIPELLSTADVLVAPFRDMPGVRYQCNMKIFEYMGLGKPIIASDVGDLGYILGDTGYLVAPGDSRDLAAKIVEIHSNPEHAKKMGKGARARVEKEFDWKVISKDLMRAYRGI